MGKGKKNPKKNPKKGAKKASAVSRAKEADEKDSDKKKSLDSCKFTEFISRVCHPPSDSELCRGCKTKFVKTDSNIPHQANQPVSFLL